jgi:Domain of unknown function (DUF1707)
VTDRRTEIRAADVDREFVADRLKIALNQGRLSLPEYDERLAAIYAAKTYADLDVLLADLPDTTPAERAQLVVPAGFAPAPRRGPAAYPWWAWLIAAITIIVVTGIVAGAMTTIMRVP